MLWIAKRVSPLVRGTVLLLRGETVKRPVPQNLALSSTCDIDVPARGIFLLKGEVLCVEVKRKVFESFESFSFFDAFGERFGFDILIDRFVSALGNYLSFLSKGSFFFLLMLSLAEAIWIDMIIEGCVVTLGNNLSILSKKIV